MKGKGWAAYGYVVAWALVIYLTVPLVRGFQQFIYRTVGKCAFGYFVLAAVAGGVVWSVFYLRQERLGVGNHLRIVGVAGLYAYFTFKLWNVPEEAVHFVEYGVLSYFVYKALLHHVRDITIYFSAAFVVLFLGTIDEIIQWVVPDRYWDFRDVVLNGLSGALFQLGVWKGIRPEMIRERVGVISIRILTGTVTANLILLGLCVSATPSRIAYISEGVPALASLAKNEEMMSEMGYRHEDDEIGAFYSRFTKEDLKKTDSERSAEYGRLLSKNRSMAYGDFLKKYSPMTAPFLHEMRVHLFRRDRYEAEGRKAQSARRKEAWTVVYRENLILERYFGETLKPSGYAWSEERRKGVAEVADTDGLYESPVSKQLFRRVTERGVWMGIGGALMGLVLANIVVSHRARRGTEEMADT